MATIDFTSVLEEHQEFVGRAWVLHAIDSWLNTPDAAPYFLVTGKVGAGKTAIAAHLAHLNRGAVAGDFKRLGPGSIAYYHFCQPRNDGTLTPLRFVESLSQTLAARYPAFAQALATVETMEVNIHVQQVVSQNEGDMIGVSIGSLRIGNLSARTAFDHVVRQPLAELFSGNFNETILIVIDSLDAAYTYPSSETIATLLRDVISQLPSAVRFLLTSQTVDQLKYDFGWPTLDLNENEEEAFQDIRTYAEQRLSRRPEPERTDLAQRIAVQADGNFVYAHHVLDLSESIADQSIGDLLTAKVEGLEDFYRQTMRRTFHPNLQQWHEQDRPLFALLCAAQGRGLTTHQLVRLLGLPEAELDIILARCDPYLTGPRCGPFHFFHDSFRSFLLEDHAIDMDPAAIHCKIGLRLIEDYRDKWLDSKWEEYETRYALRFTPRHLLLAAQSMDHLGRHDEAVAMVDKLLALFTDFTFLEAKLYRVGMGYLLTDLREACEIPLKITAEQDEACLVLRTLETLLYHERNNLQEWDRTHQPAFFAQQIRNRAVQLKYILPYTDRFVTAAEQRLAALNRPYLALTWQTNAPAKNIDGHARAVRALAITPDSQRAISGSDDRSIIIWNLQEQTLEHKRRSHTNVVTSLAVISAGQFALSGSADTTVKVWNLGLGTVERTLKGHQYSVRAVTVAPDGSYAVSASVSGRINIWNLQDTASEGAVQTIEAHAHAIRDLAVTANGQHIISASDDHTIKVWDRNGSTLYTLEGHTAPVLSVSVTPDDRFILSASADSTIRRWELATGCAVDPLITYHTSFLHVAPTLDGRQAVSTAYDVALNVWDLRTGELLRKIPAHHRDAVAAFAITHNAERAITAGEDGMLKYWDLVSGREVATIVTRHTDKLSAVALTAGGERAISADWNGKLKLWDLQANTTQKRLIRTIDGHASRVRTVVITHDDCYAVSGDNQGDLRVWNTQTGELVHQLQRAGRNAHRDAILSLTLTPDSRYVVAASVDKTITVWNLKTGKQRYRLIGHSDVVNAVAIIPDGRAISASADGTLRIWDLRKGKTALTINAHRRPVISVVVIDDTHVISVSESGTHKLWDLATGKQVESNKRYEWHRIVNCTPDGSRAVFITTAQPLQVWDLDSGAELARVVQDSAMRCAAVTPDGNMIVAGDGFGNVFCFRYIDPDNGDPHKGQTAHSPLVRIPQIFLRQHNIEDEITQRHLPDSKCRFILIEGEPGIGKTALLAGLADAKPNWLHYAIPANPLALGCAEDVRALLYTIGRQFAKAYPGLFSPNSEHHFQQHLADIQRLADLTLLRPAKRLQAKSPDTQIVVLIDGLDTFADQQAQEDAGLTTTILQWLTHGPELPSNVRMILTSAPGAHLDAFKTKRQRWLRQIQLQPDTTHLQLLVEHLQNEPALQELTANRQDSTISLAVERLLANLPTNFKPASFILHCLLHMGNNKLYRQLLTSLPSSADLFQCYAAFLEHLYDDVYADRIEIQTEALQWYREPAWSSLYQPMLGVLAIAKAPLTLEQIANLGHISVSTRWLGEGVRKLEPLLCVETSSGSAHRQYWMCHRSLAAFLLSLPTKHAFPQFYLDAKEWHRKLVAHYVETYTGNWSACDDYGLRYLMQHVINSELPEPTLFQVLNQLHIESFTHARLARADNFLSLIIDCEQIETRIPAQTTVQLYHQLISSKQLPQDLCQYLLGRLSHLQAGQPPFAATAPAALHNK